MAYSRSHSKTGKAEISNLMLVVWFWLIYMKKFCPHWTSVEAESPICSETFFNNWVIDDDGDGINQGSGTGDSEK